MTRDPGRAADGVVHRVAGNRRRQQQNRGQPEVERAGRRQRAGRKEQRIARQKRRDDQAGLRKDDEEQDGVDPDAVVGHQLEQIAVDVKQEIDEFGHAGVPE